MKKSLFTIALVSVTTFSGFGQYFKVGPKIGVNIANLNTNEALPSSVQKNSTIGFNGGLAFELGFSKVISLYSELCYSQQGYEIKQTVQSISATAKANLNYINIPVLLRTSIDLSKARVFFNLGPQFSILASTSATYVINGVTTSQSFPDNTVKGIDVSMVFGGGLGVDLGPGELFFDARYALGLNNIDATSSSTSVKNSVIGLSAGYLFKFGL